MPGFKTRQSVHLAGIWLISSLIMASGCDEDEDMVLPEIDAQNLQIHVASPSQGLEGSYAKDGDVIHFEAIRGAPRVDWAQDSDLAVEVDVRFFDRNGFIFISQNGGAEPMDSQWEVDEQHTERGETEGRVHAVDRINSFLLAKEAGVLLADLRNTAPENVPGVFTEGFSPDEMRPELDAVIGCAVHANALSEETELLAEADGEMDSTRAGSYTHIIRAYWGTMSGLGPDFEHSSTSQQRYSASTGSQVRYNCNHGRCPYQSGMHHYCTKSWGNRNSYIKWQNNCSTPFFWQHVCHDDTVLQYIDLRDNYYHSTTGGVCNDGRAVTKHPRLTCDYVPPVDTCSTTQCTTKSCCSGYRCCEGQCRPGNCY